MTQPKNEDRWQGRPGLARAIRALVMVAPITLAVLASILVSRVLPAPASVGQTIGWWVALSVMSTVVLFTVDRLARRLLPLAALLRLTLVFPDRAPSRYKVARSVATTRQLEAEIRAAREGGIVTDRERAAETVLRLVAALSVHDRATRGHAERVRVFSDMIAEELDLPERDVARLRWASLLHDVGKIFVHADILNKPGKPTDEEWEALRAHPLHGARITEPLREWLGEWALTIEQHHEQFNGTGYPYGLAGHDISLGARIVSVADAYDVMTASRPYRRPVSVAAAREELARCAGTQFDPRIVRAFLNVGLGRLRWTTGPLTWLANLPVVRTIPGLGPVAPVALPTNGLLTGMAGMAAAGATGLALVSGPPGPAVIESAARAAATMGGDRPVTTAPEDPEDLEDPATSTPSPTADRSSPETSKPEAVDAPAATGDASARPTPTETPAPAPTPSSPGPASPTGGGTTPSAPASPPAPPVELPPTTSSVPGDDVDDDLEDIADEVSGAVDDVDEDAEEVAEELAEAIEDALEDVDDDDLDDDLEAVGGAVVGGVSEAAESASEVAPGVGGLVSGLGGR